MSGAHNQVFLYECIIHTHTLCYDEVSFHRSKSPTPQVTPTDAKAKSLWRHEKSPRLLFGKTTDRTPCLGAPRRAMTMDSLLPCAPRLPPKSTKMRSFRSRPKIYEIIWSLVSWKFHLWIILTCFQNQWDLLWKGYFLNPVYKSPEIRPKIPEIQPEIPAIPEIPDIRAIRPKIFEIWLLNLWNPT